MDRARFDALARLLATGGSRRGALGALLSVTLLGQDPDILARRDKRHRKNHKNKQQQTRGDGQDPDGKGVQGEGRPGAAHKKHHRKQKTKRKRRQQRRQQDRQQDPRPPVGGGPGDPCADPGDCADQLCQTKACVDFLCVYTFDPDHTSCTLPGGGAGICRGGACVVNACQTVADCFGGTANACTDGVCICGGGSACNLFADEECCGASPGGTCVNVETDPANCGGCNNACPPGVCGVPTCAHQVCGTSPAPDNSNPGGLCGDSEVCCGGVCELIIAPQNCGTCGHVCPAPSLPCQFAVCPDRVCDHENWPDGAPGGSCTTGQCWGGICCTNPFPVCAVSGECESCTDHSQCLSGHNCCAGHCVEACCPLGNACHRTDQCCSGNCSDVLFGGVCCLGDGADCTSPGECCSVRCIGTCVGLEV